MTDQSYVSQIGKSVFSEISWFLKGCELPNIVQELIGVVANGKDAVSGLLAPASLW